MLRIRLTRVGKRNNSHFRVVVAEHSRPVKGKFLELLGTYNPIKKDIVLNKERIAHWISNGAAPSQTVARLLKNNGMEGMEKFIKHVTFTKKTEEAAA
ncbi:30S ribosomal protein S16 [Candidatus Gracilibacteria bacterium CG17_big_fil_post_rev_8_21_14_2_50_48_13]|nr:MAG: 30S ribosomal protein S16 [Candidatus Gracilibacteria bacterium CG17_big_fil_post_rev_8_21_14_2_50_48_13]